MPRQSKSFDLEPRVDAVDIDLQCALAFGRTALKALVVLSSDACLTVDRCLSEEIAAISLEGHPSSPAVESILEDTRNILRAAREDFLKSQALEARLIEAMHALNNPGQD